jgi:hypothetical protein
MFPVAAEAVLLAGCMPDDKYMERKKFLRPSPPVLACFLRVQRVKWCFLRKQEAFFVLFFRYDTLGGVYTKIFENKVLTRILGGANI